MNNISISKNHNYILNEIFSFLTEKERLLCKRVCRLFNDLIEVKNKVVVSCNVLRAKSFKEHLLASARGSVEISGNFCGGKVFRHYLTILAKKLKAIPIFRVHLISSRILLEKKDLELINKLERLYKKRFCCLITAPKWTWSGQKIENHMKLLLVDELYFMIGGTGFQDNLLSNDPSFASTHLKGKVSASAHQDMDLVGRGPFAKKVRHIFYTLYHSLEIAEGNKGASSRYFPCRFQKRACLSFEKDPEGIEGVDLKALTSFPRKKEDTITPHVIALFQQARSSICVATLGFSPTKEVLKGLLARKKGVKARVITNSPQASKKCIKLYGLASAPYFQYVDKVHLYNRPGVLYHTKVVVIDSEVALIGSYNLTAKSGASTYEIMVKVTHPLVVQKIEAQLTRDVKNTTLYKNNASNFHLAAGYSLATVFSELL